MSTACLTPALLLTLAASQGSVPPEPPFDPDVVLRVSIAGDRTEFRIGETIPLQLSFSSTVEDRYHVNKARYDRSGRMEHERFSVSPATGAVDPLAGLDGGIGGGLTSYSFLSVKPWTTTLNLNEWLRFTRPGEYELSVSSRRVGRKDASSALGESPVTARARPVRLRIVHATRSWQKATFDQAVAALEQARVATPQERPSSESSRRQALETLRFLGTPNALRELAKRLRGEDPGGDDYVCMQGLLFSPNAEAARRAIEEALADPNQAISGAFFSALRDVRSAPQDRAGHWRDNQRQAVEELLAALPAKTGKALSASLSTAVHAMWDGAALPKPTMDALVRQLLSLADQLPAEEQARLLTYSWDRIPRPAWLPIVRRWAQSYRDFPNMRASLAYESLQRSAIALQRWYELDPSGARPAIIDEIARPRPRFDARVLGLLPDRTLPELDAVLAENLVASRDPDASAHIASLVARYATDAVLPEVLALLDARIGRWECASQNPALAFVLRVSPEQARPRIELALAARGAGSSSCHQVLLEKVSEIHYDSVLEDVGIRALEDRDPQLSTSAARMLGRFGSAAAEPALWRRYASWSDSWRGREAELVRLFAERVDDRTYQMGLGHSLVQALAGGRAWLCDEDKLRRLERMTSVGLLQEELARHLTAWEQPLGIVLSDYGPSLGLRGQVAHYELHEIGALEERLGQFPIGTEFRLLVSPPESPGAAEAWARIRAFLGAQGMVVAAGPEGS